MKVSKVFKIWLDYHRAHSRPSTARAYEQFISTLHEQYGGHEVDDLIPNDILEYCMMSSTPKVGKRGLFQYTNPEIRQKKRCQKDNAA
jgi:hypothetical protein